MVASDGTVAYLKDASQQPVTLQLSGGILNNLQRIAVDAAGNIYWTMPLPTFPPNGATGRVYAWARSSATVTSYVVDGLDGVMRLPNGNVVAIVKSNLFESALRRLEPTRLGDIEVGLQGIAFQSATAAGNIPYFVNAFRLFRGRIGSIEAFNNLTSPSEPDRPFFTPTFVLATQRGLVLKASDGAFYRIENPEACIREPQPKIADGGVLNSAGFGYPNTVSHWQLLTVFGSGLGPRDGQGVTLDGLARAAAQPAPYPNLLLGQRQNGTFAGFSLPVIFSNDTQMTVQVPFVGGNELVLFWSWNGLLLIYPQTIAVRTATPGIFVQGSGRDGLAAAINQDSSINSLARPAAKGSIVQFFVTGLGGVQPTLGGPGAYNSATTLQRTVERVTARIAGSPATVEFAGAAPGFIGGLYQVNLRIPISASAGAQPVDFEVAGRGSSEFQKVTIQVE